MTRRVGSTWRQRASARISGASASISIVIGALDALRVGGEVEHPLARGDAHVEARVVDREDDQAGLELAVADGVGDLGAVLADDADPDAGVLGGEVLDEPAGQVVVGAGERAERDRPAGHLAHLADGLLASSASASVRSAWGSRRRPGLGQLEPAAGADEQRDAELGLQPAHLLGQARLRHQQRLRGRGERPVARRGEEIRELLQASRLFLSTLESTKPKTMSHKRRY